MNNPDITRVKFMRPNDIKKYTTINPQQIREGMKSGTLDIGFITNPTGRRYNYNILPGKFFAYIGIPVPIEWQ